MHARSWVDRGSPALAAAFAEETRQLLRQRLPLLCGLFLVMIVVALMGDWLYRDAGSRTASALTYYVALTVLAFAATRTPRLAQHLVVVSVAVAALLPLGAVAHAYSGTYMAEALVVAVVLYLETFAVLLPWGPGPQGLVSALVIGSCLLVLPTLPAASPVVHLVLGLLTGGAASTATAYYLAAHRRSALANASRLQEEAEVSAALVDVGRTLSAAVGKPDMFERICALIVDRLAASHCSIFFLDERRDAYRLAGNSGSSPEDRALLESLEFPRAALPVRNTFQPGRLVEIPGSPLASHLPPDLLRRFGASFILCAPIARGEAVVGVIAIVSAESRPPSSEPERRLALGIADAVAVALENHRLVGDLQRANELKSEFVSTMSHELRTPLNVISGYCEILADPEVGPLTQVQTDALLRVRRGTNDLLELVNASLDLSRLDAGRDLLRLAPVSIPSLLPEILDELDGLIDRARVEVRADGSDLEGSLAITDHSKLQTILRNLLSNAFKFTPAGSVEVVAKRDGDALVLRVSDTGIGIAPEHASMIFDMFRQVDGSPTRKFSGVGLGLYIVRRQVEALSGEVRVESELGQGSTFTVRLPTRFVTDGSPALEGAVRGDPE